MIGMLKDAQIDRVLQSQVVGRLGCCSNDRMTIVPVTYVYHDGYIYLHSKDGAKMQMMRDNPNVCFQVDEIDSMTYWRSVVIQGRYEELTTHALQLHALELLADRLAPFLLSETVRPVRSESAPSYSRKKSLKAVAYRIEVIEKTGRFEKA